MAGVTVLDASALIAHLDERDAHHARAREILEGAADARICASVVTLAETLVAPTRAGVLDRARAALDDLGVDPVALAHDAAGELAALRADTGLRMPDCCVLHAAAMAGAETVVTFDRRLARAAELRGLRTP